METKLAFPNGFFEMPPRRGPPLGSTGFRGVRARPAGNFAAEITCAGRRMWLGTFASAHEAARAYDAVAWRFGRPRRDMNFPEIETREDAEMLAGQPLFLTQEDRRLHLEAQRQIDIHAADERAMAEWRRTHPADVAAEMEFWAAREAEKKEKEKEQQKEDERRRNEAGPSTVGSYDDDDSFDDGVDWDALMTTDEE